LRELLARLIMRSTKSTGPSNDGLRVRFTAFLNTLTGLNKIVMSQPQPVSSQSYPTQPHKPYWTVGRILGLILGLIILGGIGAFAYSQFRVSQSGSVPIAQVTVSGTAQTGFTSTVVRVEFAQYSNAVSCAQSVSYCPCPEYQYGNSCYTSSHSAGVNSGQYSTILSNRSGWNVFLIYDNYYKNGYYYNSQSYCYAGSVTVDGLSGTYNYDVRC
jgi:hypothetical protein